MQETVVLVHGILMSGKVMLVLARRLQRRGYRTVLFDYPTRRHGMRENARALARCADGLGPGRVHLVGHSLGGMLILRALQEHPGMPPGRVVLLGAPIHGSQLARRLWRYAPGRWLLGASAEDGLLEPVPECDYGREIGVIAGELPLGVGLALGGLDGRHDGTVGVDEACFRGATDTLVVKVSHSSMVFSMRVAGQVCHFLRQGRFALPSPPA